MKKLIILLLVVLCLSSCKDSTMQQFKALGSRHKVTLYGATGTIIGQWETTGSVSNEQYSDGWYFKDEKSGKLIELTGTIVIAQE